MDGEPTITVNGFELSQAQAMTVRVALTDFVSKMNEPYALGEDEVGKAIASGYAVRGMEVLNFMK